MSHTSYHPLRSRGRCGATLAAVAAAPDDDGLQRIELAIEWNEPGRRGHPLRLAGWLRGTSGEGAP